MGLRESLATLTQRRCVNASGWNAVSHGRGVRRTGAAPLSNTPGCYLAATSGSKSRNCRHAAIA